MASLIAALMAITAGLVVRAAWMAYQRIGNLRASQNHLDTLASIIHQIESRSSNENALNFAAFAADHAFDRRYLRSIRTRFYKDPVPPIMPDLMKMIHENFGDEGERVLAACKELACLAFLDDLELGIRWRSFASKARAATMNHNHQTQVKPKPTSREKQVLQKTKAQLFLESFFQLSGRARGSWSESTI